MKLIVASGNAHKREEIGRILTPLGITVASPEEAGLNLDSVEETGSTFAENARIKALALYQSSGFGVVADDSGLCVDALDGRPGVFSARYLGENTSYPEKMRGLLAELEHTPDDRRTARFVSAVCCVLPDGGLLECEGVCEGSISYAPHGSGGFGYDPIFLVGGKSFAELTPEEKDAMSHRGRALRKLEGLLTAWMKSHGNE